MRLQAWRRGRGWAAIGLLLCLSMMMQSGASAAAPGATLATEDTVLRVEARQNRVALVSLKSPQTGWDWIAAPADQENGNHAPELLPLIDSAQVEGRSTPLAWKFVGSSVPEG